MANTTFTQSLSGKKSLIARFRTLVLDNNPLEYREPQPEFIMTVEKEMLLWKKIDGECTPDEEEKVNYLLQNNPEFLEEYKSMLAMHRSFSQLLGKSRDRRIGDRNED